MKRININNNIKLIFRTYLLVLSIFSIFRVILFFTEINLVDFSKTSITSVLQAFFIGIRFDAVIAGYILLLPAIVLFILDFFANYEFPVVKKIIFFWIFILFTFAFIISSADIPYFNQFFDRFSVGAFEWIENFGFVLSMITQEPKYFLIVIPFILLSIIFYKILRRIFNYKTKNHKTKTWLKVTYSLLFLMIMLIGIRGRIEQKSPIRIGTAYFSDNSFLNKLGLNPVFTLIKSYLNSKDSRNATINLIDDKKAEINIKKYLNIDTLAYNSPIARKINFDSNSIKPNIVLIMMESMSAAKMKRHGNDKELTPFLDSLSYKSIYFDNAYTSGKHTFNGIFSTLFSFPAIYRQHPLKKIQQYDGISSTLLKNNYTTTYFTTHDGQFDNVEGFLRENDFQNVYSQKDYPAEEVKTTLGVPDDYMFRYSLPIINKLSEKDKPFFVSFMTVSDHGPYYIPDYFKPKSEKIQDQIVEYADWSLENFIKESSKQDWFNNTIFVFVADHGSAMNPNYYIPLNYFHSPLLFYSPKILKQSITYKSIASQTDIYPTLMGLLKIPYVNNTLGIDLLNEKRKFAIINDDDKIGILDSTYFCILKDGKSKLYKYKEKDKTDYSAQNKELLIEMTDFAKSNLQIYQNMIINKETSIKVENQLNKQNK